MILPGYRYQDFKDELAENSEHPIRFKNEELKGISGLPSQSLYDIIKGNVFMEEFGVYYQEELSTTNSTGGSSTSTPTGGSSTSNPTNSLVPEASKHKAMVVTYTMQ